MDPGGGVVARGGGGSGDSDGRGFTHILAPKMLEPSLIKDELVRGLKGFWGAQRPGEFVGCSHQHCAAAAKVTCITCMQTKCGSHR